MDALFNGEIDPVSCPHTHAAIAEFQMDIQALNMRESIDEATAYDLLQKRLTATLVAMGRIEKDLSILRAKLD